MRTLLAVLIVGLASSVGVAQPPPAFDHYAKREVESRLIKQGVRRDIALMAQGVMNSYMLTDALFGVFRELQCSATELAAYAKVTSQPASGREALCSSYFDFRIAQSHKDLIQTQVGTRIAWNEIEAGDFVDFHHIGRCRLVSQALKRDPKYFTKRFDGSVNPNEFAGAAAVVTIGNLNPDEIEILDAAGFARARMRGPKSSAMFAMLMRDWLFVGSSRNGVARTEFSALLNVGANFYPVNQSFFGNERKLTVDTLPQITANWGYVPRLMIVHQSQRSELIAALQFATRDCK